jgi:Fe-S cluster assembly protein SufD
VFRGNIFVHKDAVGTDTDENNRSLILTEGARADATPFLEIECADITAGHGSATGQIDARHLFYLESRGIPREEALRLIVTGFFREVLTEVELPGVEDRATEPHRRRASRPPTVAAPGERREPARGRRRLMGDPRRVALRWRTDPRPGRRRRRAGVPRPAR